ncbi:hypothetical protein B932_1414 [Gluconobacter oxydans H24]|nr:hypothetical protein B932_1414 [Gluconobacter oxydans H24]
MAAVATTTDHVSRLPDPHPQEAGIFICISDWTNGPFFG